MIIQVLQNKIQGLPNNARTFKSHFCFPLKDHVKFKEKPPNPPPPPPTPSPTKLFLQEANCNHVIYWYKVAKRTVGQGYHGEVRQKALFFIDLKVSEGWRRGNDYCPRHSVIRGFYQNPGSEDVPLMELVYLVFTHMVNECYCRQLTSLLLFLCDAFWMLINSLACSFKIKDFQALRRSV